ncbi:MAG TPA: restriction endonuclease subunit S [Nostocaceae cyanobacterium]|nr:restriction endonuclease subunit S [Nostocaceae cyanobacterium]
MKRYPKYKDSGLVWLGEIPEHWEVKRAKYFFTEIDERSEKGEEELLSVSHITGVTPRSEKNINMFMAESYEGYKTCIPHDLVINIMWAWMGALGISKHKGIVSSAYGVYRLKPNNKFDYNYLDYLVRIPEYIAEYISRSKGIRSSRLRMYSDDFFQIPIIYPPVEEQKNIVDFLNRKLEQIDQFINNKKRLIELLKEQKTAIINRAVTKGLNPHVPMKPSGIEWLGDIPSHWEMVRNINIFKEVVETGYENLELLSIFYDRGVVKQNESGRKNRSSVDKSSYKRILKGDIGYNLMNAFIGSIGVSSYDGIISPAYAVCRPTVVLDSHYFHYLFRTPLYLVEFDRHSYGIMDERNRLYFNNFKKIYVPFPPVNEQTEIVKYINQNSATIDQAIAKAEKEIELIQEYRTTLISDAVTGKIDVRE